MSNINPAQRNGPLRGFFTILGSPFVAVGLVLILGFCGAADSLPRFALSLLAGVYALGWVVGFATAEGGSRAQ